MIEIGYVVFPNYLPSSDDMHVIDNYHLFSTTEVPYRDISNKKYKKLLAVYLIINFK